MPTQETAPAVPDASVFAAVPAALRPALQRRGFTQLTEVQTAVLAADDGEHDLRITSQTGSGKTVALGLALLARVAANDRKGPTTLVIAPTRELAAQVKEELEWLFADLPQVRCEVVTGGTNIARERQQLKRRPAVVVGTPGRLLDHIENKALDLSSVGQLVLDEADQMLDLGFKDELDAILEVLPKQRRTHLVSATFPNAVKALADRFQQKVKLVAGTPAGAAHGDIEHIAVKVAAREQYAVLVNLLLLAGDERTLVFVRTREDTQGLADKLAGDGFLALPIHGELAQAQRTRTLQAFRRGAIHTLIATDVAARGLDIADVTSVINFDPPIDSETYVHRSGRTGRAGQKGRSYMLVVKTRANFVRRLYEGARLQASLQGSPGAEEVLAVQRARAGERAEAVLNNGTAVPPALTAIAANLLAGRDPQTVVAALLANAVAGVREPFVVTLEREVESPAVPPAPAPVTVKPARAAAIPAVAAVEAEAAEAEPAHAATTAARKATLEHRIAALPKHTTSKHAPETTAAPTIKRLTPEQRGKPGAVPAWQKPKKVKPVAAEQAFTRFRINWGTRDGADARRILAHVCRRGGVDGKLIGTIDVHATMTTFGVAATAAASFERRALRADHREPHLLIVRDRVGTH